MICYRDFGKARLLPVQKSDTGDQGKMLVASGQRETIFQRDRGDPDVVLRNQFPKQRQVRSDSPVKVSCLFVGTKNRTELDEILDLLESLGLERRFEAP
jgi:hypothetical protein